MLTLLSSHDDLRNSIRFKVAELIEAAPYHKGHAIVFQLLRGFFQRDIIYKIEKEIKDAN